MSKLDKDYLLEQCKDELESKRKQLKEIKFSYELAKDRLNFVEKRIKTLEQQIDQILSGQMPLPLDF